MQNLKVGVAQLNSRADKQKNVEMAIGAIRQAAGKNADLVVLPEYFNCLGSRAAMLENAERIPGPTTETMAQLARDSGTAILCGSIPEISANSGKIRNTAVFIDETGEILACYSKIHLFDIDLPGKVAYRESDAIEPGSAACTFAWHGLKIGLAICYDLRFPELFRRLMQQGAEMILVGAAFTRATGKYHWQPLIRSRAIENQVFVCAANQCGEHPDFFPTFGGSGVIDPWGRSLCRLEQHPGVAVADLDMTELRRIRRESPILTHIQPWLLKDLG